MKWLVRWLVHHTLEKKAKDDEDLRSLLYYYFEVTRYAACGEVSFSPLTKRERTVASFERLISAHCFGKIVPEARLPVVTRTRLPFVRRRRARRTGFADIGSTA